VSAPRGLAQESMFLLRGNSKSQVKKIHIKRSFTLTNKLGDALWALEYSKKTIKEVI
jgi:hypothetical protein